MRFCITYKQAIFLGLRAKKCKFLLFVIDFLCILVYFQLTGRIFYEDICKFI